jgi:hypothetical protein
MARLHEIYLQQMGVQALLQEEVATQLGISDELMSKIQEANRESMSDMMEQMRQLRESDNRQQMMAKMRELREKAEQKVLGLLSPEQQEKFEQMKGAEFEMPRGGGRGRRAPAGGPTDS